MQHGHKRLGALDVWLQRGARRQQEVEARRVPRDTRAEERRHARLVGAVKRGTPGYKQLDQGRAAAYARTHQRREAAAVGAVERHRGSDKEACTVEVASLAAEVQWRLAEPVGHVEEIQAPLQEDAGDSPVAVLTRGVQRGAIELTAQRGLTCVPARVAGGLHRLDVTQSGCFAQTHPQT